MPFVNLSERTENRIRPLEPTPWCNRMPNQSLKYDRRTPYPANDTRTLLRNDRRGPAGYVFVDGARALILALAGLALVANIGLFDYLTGPELSFAVLYFIPIALAAWWGGLAPALLLAMASVVSWQTVEIAEGSRIHPSIQVWNGLTRFGIFVITSSLLARLRLSLVIEKKLARSDQLTGAANGRTFYESVSQAVERSLRTANPLTLVYLDLDNFKWLNDTRGHAAGDEALCLLVQTVHDQIRITDLLARIGGDEFALLLLDCDDEDAKMVLDRLQDQFAQEMNRRSWPVTMSIGSMTFARPLRDVDAMVRYADNLMYTAKKHGKNRIVCEVMNGMEDVVAAESSAVVERRATARVLCDRLARVRPEGESSDHDEFARVQNLSASDLCLRLDRQLPNQTLVAVEPLHDCGAKTLLVRVIWSAPKEGGWLHECALANPLNPDELQLWLSEQVAEACHAVPVE